MPIASVPPVRPKLLVSVRDADEAIAAFSGGADIIDVKEPANGSLGRAPLTAIMSVAECVAAFRCKEQFPDVASLATGNSEAHLSVALGEVTEWMISCPSWSDEVLAHLPLARPRYLKLGLAGLSCRSMPQVSWTNSWMHVRNQIRGDHAWVAVAYADHARAESPTVEDVFSAAVATGCEVLLIDTFEKDGSNLFDFITGQQLHDIRSCTTQKGLQLAVAGQITQRDLSNLLPVYPDIIAVRGAVCEGDNRKACVNSGKVRALVQAIEAGSIR